MKPFEWDSHGSVFDQEADASQSLAYLEKHIFFLVRCKHQRDRRFYFGAEKISISCQLGLALF